MSAERDRGPEAAPLTVVQLLGAQAAGRLTRYVEMADRWSRAVGLVGGGSPATRLWALIEDSLAALPHLPQKGRLLDVGSGVGIPSVPLLLARPGLQGVLLEPRERRWAFLREVVRELDLPAEVRRERLSSGVGTGFVAMTVRGVERSHWEGLAGRVLAADGVVVWWTGERIAAEPPGGGEVRVLLCPMPAAGRGALVVWSPRST
ncbi:MAG: class I SAM-dependent methyltransferase [Thermoanaerobaculaceae bacterium]|jgi:16S rRNA (guanine527-N7)-methyltransferase|nr:class I SAM-dependent methyltransferase [Thermoanaerobaculaceae bacterium]